MFVLDPDPTCQVLRIRADPDRQEWFQTFSDLYPPWRIILGPDLDPPWRVIMGPNPDPTWRVITDPD
jgi:hypothetical protein